LQQVVVRLENVRAASHGFALGMWSDARLADRVEQAHRLGVAVGSKCRALLPRPPAATDPAGATSTD
jgi:hypothetical protein